MRSKNRKKKKWKKNKEEEEQLEPIPKATGQEVVCTLDTVISDCLEIPAILGAFYHSVHQEKK